MLFVDLVGFTSASESRDPEDSRLLLDRYYDAAKIIVQRYGGVIEKFIGDAVMAIWGAPIALGDDAQRAVRAGLDLVAEVQLLAESQAVEGLQARGGVVTGVVATTGNSDVALVVGDSVNTASRVQGAASPGQVYVDDTTRAASGAAIAFEDAGVHELKGKSEAVRLWRAQRVLGGTGAAPSLRIDGLEADFVGRNRDLAVLKEVFHASAEDSRARLITVIGEAGIGKSRLEWEFEKYIEGLAQNVMWHRGRCLSYGDGVTYAALAEMVRMRFRIAENAPVDETRRTLGVALQRLFPDAEQRETVAAAVGMILGTEQADLGRDALFAGWRQLFQRLSADGPVAMIVEDVQWADSGLLDFIEHLLDWGSADPIFVLVLTRPEFTQTHPAWLADRRDTMTLYLDRLPDESMAQMLTDLVPNLPEATRDRIVERAEGIPLYAVETIRSLIDRDVVVPRDGVYQLVGHVEELDIPPSLTSLIGSRLDVLAPGERNAVKQLSVLGATFPMESARAITGLEGPAMSDVLRALVRKDVLAIRTDSLAPDRGHYTFVQSLLRQVAYETLTNRERREQHRRVAAHLRDTLPDDGEEVCEVIAAHLHQAWLAGAPDDENLRRETVEAFRRSGLRARSLASPVAAVRAFETAAELSTAPDEQADLLLLAGQTSEQGDLWSDTTRLYERLVTRHRQTASTTDLARCLVRLGINVSREGDAERSLKLLTEGIDLLEAGDPGADLAEAYTEYAGSLLFSGENTSAEAPLERGLVLAQALDEPRITSRAAMYFGFLRFRQGRPDEAVAMSQLGVSAMERAVGSSRELAVALHNLGGQLLDLNRPLGEETTLRCIDLARRLGSVGLVDAAVSSLCGPLLAQGRWAEVAAHVERDLSAQPTHMEPSWRLVALRLAAERGDLENARHHAAALSDEAMSSGTPEVRLLGELGSAIVAHAADDFATAARLGAELFANMHGVLGPVENVSTAFRVAVDALIRLERMDEARGLLSILHTYARGQLPPSVHAEVSRSSARLAAADDDDAEAELGFAEALRLFSEIGFHHFRALTLLDQAAWLERTGRLEDAAAARAEGAARLLDMGALTALTQYGLADTWEMSNR